MRFIENKPPVRRQKPATRRGCLGKDERVVHHDKMRVRRVLPRVVDKAARIIRTASSAAFLARTGKKTTRQAVVVVEIAVADEALVKRLSGRRVCLNCGATYHVSTLGGKTTCDKCGEELIQRKDDNPETVQNRLNVYHSQTAPLISFYQERGLLKTFDGMQDIDVVYQSIMDALRKAE